MNSVDLSNSCLGCSIWERERNHWDVWGKGCQSLICRREAKHGWIPGGEGPRDLQRNCHGLWGRQTLSSDICRHHPLSSSVIARRHLGKGIKTEEDSASRTGNMSFRKDSGIAGGELRGVGGLHPMPCLTKKVPFFIE